MGSRADDPDGAGGPGPAAGEASRPEFAWRAVCVIAAVTGAVVLCTAFGYGYYRDELYFRRLGEQLAWGYVDAGPVTPLLARGGVELFGDSVFAVRVPAALLGAATIVLTALLARELGGGRGAQILAALGTSVSLFPLITAHTLLTNSFDLPLSLAMVLFVARALLRDDGRWWLAAGAVVGIALYNKALVVLLVLGIVVALLVVGPRRVFAGRWLWLGALVMLVSTAPNIVYQAVNGWPQRELTAGLAAAHGVENRIAFVPQQLLLLGPFLVPIWVAGAVGLWRAPEWRPVRALVVGAVVSAVLFLVAGGRPDYTVPLLLTLLAAGSVRTVRWLTGHPTRPRRVAAALALNAVFAAVVALPVLPQRALAATGLVEVDQVVDGQLGWPDLADQVAAVYAGLPGTERTHTVVLTGNYGEEGALDRFGAGRLPSVYSGHNQLYEYGPPPASAATVIAVGLDDALTTRLFAECRVVSRIRNSAGVPTEETDERIQVCRGARGSWTALWPLVRHVD